MNTKILIIGLMILAVFIGLGIAIYANQVTNEAEEFGFNSAGELMASNALNAIANMSFTLGSVLTIFILFVLPIIGIGIGIWWVFQVLEWYFHQWL